MSPPEPRSIRLDNAKCLMAETDPVRVALIQPVGMLVTADLRGPHYGETERDSAIRRSLSFLEVARSKQADLVVAPEYFSPREAIEKLVANPALLREHTLYILPIESLTFESHMELAASGESAGFEVHTPSLNLSENRHYVNLCAIFYRSNRRKILLLQAKTYGAFAEKPALISGNDFFLIEGKHSCCLVLLCSDGNNHNIYRAWTEAADQKPGAIVVHCQCNRLPDYPQHGALWAGFLQANLGQNRLIFSMNWGQGTTIQDADGSYVIKTPRSRFIRGKILQQSSRYRRRSAAGLHYERRMRFKPSWELWHLTDPGEHCVVMELVPPFEIAPREQQYRNKGVLSSQLYQITNAGVFETDTINLARYFWNNCEAYEVEKPHYSSIERMPLSELERFCNSCLLRPDRYWLSKDIAVRIPTAQLTCLSGDCYNCNNADLPCCEERERWLEKTQLVCHCLKSFYEKSHSHNFQVSLNKAFPLNLLHSHNSSVGWLFHAGGKPVHTLAKTIAKRLNETKISEWKGTIYLFAVGESEELEEKNLYPGPSTSVSDTDRGDQDILDLSHQPRFAISHL